MKPYGMNRLQHGDDDLIGCVANGRPSRFNKMRSRPKRRARKIIKRRARVANQRLCREEE